MFAFALVTRKEQQLVNQIIRIVSTPSASAAAQLNKFHLFVDLVKTGNDEDIFWSHMIAFYCVVFSLLCHVICEHVYDA